MHLPVLDHERHTRSFRWTRDRPVGRGGARLMGGAEPPAPPIRPARMREPYRFRFTRSARISSDAEITRAFAWNPRWATIRFVNSCARSTLDISNAPAVS
jgi:hypothetical protein